MPSSANRHPDGRRRQRNGCVCMINYAYYAWLLVFRHWRMLHTWKTESMVVDMEIKCKWLCLCWILWYIRSIIKVFSDVFFHLI